MTHGPAAHLRHVSQSHRTPHHWQDRDFVLQARGIDLLHRNSLAIIGTSRGSQTGPPSDWHDAFPSTPYPEKPRGVTRVSSTLCGGLIRIINGHKLVVSVVMNVDPLMALVPTSLINFVTRSLACAGFSMCRKQVRYLCFDGARFKGCSTRGIFSVHTSLLFGPGCTLSSPLFWALSTSAASLKSLGSTTRLQGA
jgi:hypothetical protein